MEEKVCLYCNKIFKPKKKRQMYCCVSCSTRSRYDDLKDKKFNRLQVIEFSHSTQSGHRMWKCLCDCGTETIVSTHSLQTGHTKSCGCLSKEITGKMNRKKLGESSFNTLYSNYKRGAKRRGHDFNLTKEEFRMLTKQTCVYCGCEPRSGYHHNTRYGNYIYNGIDRIDNSKGYDIDNVETACGICNQMKHSMVKDEFLGYITNIYKNCVESK